MITRGIAELVALGAAAITSIWISRVMGAEALGLFAVAAAVLAFAQALTDFGTPSLGAQLVADQPAGADLVWRRVTRVRATGAVVGVIVGAIALAAWSPGPPLRDLLIASLVALMINPFNANFLLVSIGAIRSVALLRAIGAVTSTCIAVLFIGSRTDSAALSLLLVAPGLVSAVGSVVLVPRHLHAPGRLDGALTIPSGLLAWYRRGFDYAKADLSLLVYMSSDRLILFATAGGQVVGLYEAAYRLVQPFYALSTVIRESMFVELAHAMRSGDAASTLRRWTRLMFVATIPLGPFLSIHAGWVIRIVYGPSFEPAAVPLAILGWAITIGFLSGVVVLPFLSWNLGREYGNAVLAGNVTNVAGNVALTPFLGAAGAALATVAAKVAVTGAGLRPFYRVTAFPILTWFGRFLAAALVAAIASAAVLVVTREQVAAVVVFVAVYGCSVALGEVIAADRSSTVRSDQGL